METTAFDHAPAGAVENEATIGGILQQLGQDHMLPVVGALLAVALLIRLAVVIITLFVIIALWCFAVAWIALFWAQTVLFEWTARFLRACMRDQLLARPEAAEHVEITHHANTDEHTYATKHDTQAEANATGTDHLATELATVHDKAALAPDADTHAETCAHDTSAEITSMAAETTTTEKATTHTERSPEAQEQHQIIESLEDAEAYVRKIAEQRALADAQGKGKENVGEAETNAAHGGEGSSTIWQKPLDARDEVGKTETENIDPGGQPRKHQQGSISNSKSRVFAEVNGNTKQSPNARAPHLRLRAAAAPGNASGKSQMSADKAPTSEAVPTQFRKPVNPFAGPGALEHAKLFMAEVKKNGTFKLPAQRPKQHQGPSQYTTKPTTQVVPQNKLDQILRSPASKEVLPVTPAETGIIPPHLRRSMEATQRRTTDRSTAPMRQSSLVSSQSSSYQHEPSNLIVGQKDGPPAAVEDHKVSKGSAEQNSRLDVHKEPQKVMAPPIIWSLYELEGLQKTCGLIPLSFTDQTKSNDRAKPIKCLKYDGWAHESTEVPENHESCVPTSKAKASVITYSKDVLKALRVAGKSSEQLDLLPKHARSTSGLKMFQCLKCWKWAHESAEASFDHKRCLRCAVLEELSSHDPETEPSDADAADAAKEDNGLGGQVQAQQIGGPISRDDCIRASSVDKGVRTEFATQQPPPNPIDISDDTPLTPRQHPTSGLAPTAPAFFVPSKPSSQEPSSEGAVEFVNRPAFQTQLLQQKPTPLPLTSSFHVSALPGLGMAPTGRLPARPSVQELFDAQPYGLPRFVPVSELASLTVHSPPRPALGGFLPEWFMQEASTLGPLNSVHYASESFGTAPAQAASLAAASYHAGLLAASTTATQSFSAAPAALMNTFHTTSTPNLSQMSSNPYQSSGLEAPVAQTPFLSLQDKPQAQHSLKLFRPPQEALPGVQPALTRRRTSLAVPIKTPAGTEIDTQARDLFTNPPTIENKATPPRPPGLGLPKKNAQAAFDALISSGSASSAGAQPAKLIDILESPNERQHQEVAKVKGSNLEQPVNDQWRQDEFPTPAEASMSSISKVEATPVKSKERSELKEKKKGARAALTDAWFEREEIRKKLAQTFDLKLAVKLQDLTREYHEKRNALQGLMGTGALNDDDAKAFPVLGLSNLTVPKFRPQGHSEWQARRAAKKNCPRTIEKDHATKQSPVKTTVTEEGEPEGEGEAAPEEAPEKVTEEEPEDPDELKDLIEKMEQAKVLRRDSLDYFNQPRPNTNVSYATWKARGESKRVRADKFYRLKLQALGDYYPNGMPEDLRKEYPYIL
ncbi:unnamed protein product [Zymoseptoria tritici ST99CH_1A5]|uniref:Uncharacterized protein n=1 Tax=Zymoseptoria tritici ST99CH_1A5 TaxID=1276529 RepID=A0A1Y6L8H9_ZYMTR|nr:unnamed protein product [Zymoseptoria tritici ST99CH_1A5]